MLSEKYKCDQPGKTEFLVAPLDNGHFITAVGVSNQNHADGRLDIMPGDGVNYLYRKLSEAGAVAYLTITGTSIDAGQDRLPGRQSDQMSSA